MLAAIAAVFQRRSGKSLIVLGSDLAWGAAGFHPRAPGCVTRDRSLSWLLPPKPSDLSPRKLAAGPEPCLR